MAQEVWHLSISSYIFHIAAKHMRGMGKGGVSHGFFLLWLLGLWMRSSILCTAFGTAGKDSFSKDFVKRWPQTVLSDSEKFERIASHLRERPEYVEDAWTLTWILLMRTVREHYPDAQLKLEGSNADGTALHGISDYDVWIYTPEPLTKSQRRRLYGYILKSIKPYCLIEPRAGGIGRKAMKFRFKDLEADDPIGLDVVCVNMDHDIGLDEHDYPSFTRSSSRNQARLRATEHVRSCPKSAAAILMMKAFTLDGRRSLIPGYILNHFALRICQEIDGGHSAYSSSTLFHTMVKHFLSFCELQEAFRWRKSDFQAMADVMDSKILLDLWKDCVHYDLVHRGATRSNRLRKTFRHAYSVLRLSLIAVMDNDQNFIREHECLKRCPENYWS